MIRPATQSDLPHIVALLADDAARRNALDQHLWRSTTDGAARLALAVEAALRTNAAAPLQLLLVAEGAPRERLLGVAHAMIVPVPPIYDPPGSPGLFLDDCTVSQAAPDGTAEALILAAEAALRAAGAPALIASCPAAGPLRPLYERLGYEPVTLYMVKHGFGADAHPPPAHPQRVRPAAAADVPGIVGLSADHRRTLEALNPRFWHIHAEADARFDQWMRRSLTLADRDMLVATASEGIEGYAIAQPCPPLLVPLVHDVAAVGVIDDYYHQDFARVADVANGGAQAADLLAAAEAAFARRRIDSALVVCPAAWTSKIALLEGRGYRTAKLWMLKR